MKFSKLSFLLFLAAISVFFSGMDSTTEAHSAGVDIKYRVVREPFEMFDVDRIKPSGERLLVASCGFIRVSWGDDIQDIHELQLAIQGKENLIFVLDSKEISDDAKSKFDKKGSLIAYARTSGRLQGNLIYLLRDRVNYSEVEHVVAHEIGHNLGLADNDNPRSLMYSYINDSQGADDVLLTQADKQEFCDIHHCNPEELDCPKDF